MSVTVKCHLGDILHSMGWDYKTLHLKSKEYDKGGKNTGIREATISEWCRNENVTFSRTNIELLMTILNLTDLSQLITVEVN